MPTKFLTVQMLPGVYLSLSAKFSLNLPGIFTIKKGVTESSAQR